MERGSGNSDGKSSFGALLRFYREQAHLSQAELMRRTSVTRDYICNMERGKIKIVYPDKFNPLHDALGFPGWELLEKMGYKTDGSLEGVDSSLLTFIRALTPEQQLQALELLRTAKKFGSSSGEPTIF